MGKIIDYNEPEQSIYWKVENDSIIYIFNDSTKINLNLNHIKFDYFFSPYFFIMSNVCKKSPIEFTDIFISTLSSPLNYNRKKEYIVLTIKLYNNCFYEVPLTIYIDKKSKLPVKMTYAYSKSSELNFGEFSLSSKKIKRKTKKEIRKMGNASNSDFDKK